MTSKKYANFTFGKSYNVKVSYSIGGNPIDLEIKDDDGDWFTISKDGGKTVRKHWSLKFTTTFPNDEVTND